MTQEIEIEYKNLLTKQEFDRLTDFFGFTKDAFKLQENHYFDTPDFQLKASGAALRIRFKHGNYVLTLKEPAEIGLLETHQQLNKEEAEGLLYSDERLVEGAITKQLQNLGVNSDNLRFFGTLSTSRAEKNTVEGLIVLDHSRYLNKEDYEIEVEVTNAEEGYRSFQNLLASHQIPVRKTPNKIKRFYDQKLLTENK
jgi:uncharacterized protein YjbK